MPNVSWKRARLHALSLPAQMIPLSELRWQLDLSWWREADRHFSVTPNQLKHEPELHARHWAGTMAADLDQRAPGSAPAYARPHRHAHAI
jgi:hypothetical protein